MFYQLIEKKRNSAECTIRELLQSIYKTGKMRDAQFEAIKTYLFLKIACNYMVTMFDLYIIIAY